MVRKISLPIRYIKRPLSIVIKSMGASWLGSDLGSLDKSFNLSVASAIHKIGKIKKVDELTHSVCLENVNKK